MLSLSQSDSPQARHERAATLCTSEGGRVIFLFAGLGLMLVGTIYIGSVVFDIEPPRRESITQGSPMAPFITEKESP